MPTLRALGTRTLKKRLGGTWVPLNSLLTWAPPDTTGYTTVNVPTTGYTSTLDHNTDYRFVMPSTPVTGPVWIKGGRNVVMVGGEIKIDTVTYTTAPGASETTQTGIYIIRHPTAGVRASRIVHIEGVKIHGRYLSDGIRTASNDGGPTDVDLRVQNCHIATGMWYRDSSAASGGQGSPHPDIVQPFGGLGWFRVDGLTALVSGQGLTLTPDFNGPNQGFMQLRRVNVRENDVAGTEYNDPAATWPRPAGDNFRSRYFWWTDGGEGGVRVDPGTVWFDHPLRAFSSAGVEMFWPETGTYGTDGTGTYAVPPHSAGWDGTGTARVYDGPPPGGDYVTTAGTGYVSPGYQ